MQLDPYHHAATEKTITSWCALNYKLVENPFASTVHIYSFSAHNTVINREQHKSISTINAAIMENTECSIVKVLVSFINLKVGVSLAHVVSLCFVLL